MPSPASHLDPHSAAGDVMTVYGTQLALPFTAHPYAVGSVSIIDPLYTLPLLVGAGWARVGHGSAGGLRANALGWCSAPYLGWGLVAQQQVEGRRFDLHRGLPWLWQRMWGHPLLPPR